VSSSFDGRVALVAGGGGTGMGASAARILAEHGADVTVLDLRPPATGSVAFRATNLGDPRAIDAAIAELGDRVDVLINAQGISGAAPGTTGIDVMRVNVLGVRHLTEALLPRMPSGGAVVSIASAGGLGWQRRLGPIDELLATPDFDAGLRWCEANEERVLANAMPKAYAFSKQALIVWTMRRAVSAIAAGVRINCTSPGSTETAMAVDFPGEGIAYMNQPSGRSSTPDEQAGPLVFLAGEAASYVVGVNLVVDGGNAAARTFDLLETAIA
jgi:NAD(P)-dependent dehydrogenase (short-subunit alcohol dehydrogenase family)